MTAMSRRKGANHEREIVNILKACGHSAARNLDQVRDGGGDIPFGDWLIECKRRASIAVYEWWGQVTAACLSCPPAFRGGENPFPKPLLVIRADNQENLAVLRLTDFLELIKGTNEHHSDSDA